MGLSATVGAPRYARIGAVTLGCLFMIVGAVDRQDSLSIILVISGLTAGAVDLYFARFARGSDRRGWRLLGIGQLLNGMGNLAWAPGIPADLFPGWYSTAVFNSATLITVIGMFCLIAPTGQTRKVLEVTADIVIACTCMFIVIWVFDLERTLTGEVSGTTVLGVLGVIALVLDLIGLSFGWQLFRTRGRGRRMANILAWFALLSAFIGDINGPNRIFNLPESVNSLTWVLSSSLLMIGGTLIPADTTDRTLRSQRTPVDLLMVAILATACAVFFSGAEIDVVAQVVLLGLTVMILARTSYAYWTNFYLRRALEHEAHHDRLTGLPNRLAFERALAVRLDESPSATVLFCDLDGFKEINDSHGHQVGDAVLIEVANRLQRVLADVGQVSRLGGDEFTALIRSDVNPARLHELMEIAQRVVAEPIHIDERSLQVTLSGGASMFDASNAADIMMHADLALHAAKDRGRNLFLVYEPEMRHRVLRRFSTGQRLRGAVEGDELSLWFQPIESRRPGDPRRVEALLRWFDEDGTPVLPPNELVDLAQTLGFTAELSRWVVLQAVQTAGEWKRAGVSINVSFNMNSHQVLSIDLPQLLLSACAEHDVDPGTFTVEMTEAALIDQPEVLHSLYALRRHGTRVSLDDFGTGYANFTALIELPIDEIKLDQSFLSGPKDSPRRDSVIASITRLAKEIGLATTAEGIETDHQFDLAAALGVDYLQGYLLARPMPAQRVLEHFTSAGERSSQPTPVS